MKYTSLAGTGHDPSRDPPHRAGLIENHCTCICTNRHVLGLNNLVAFKNLSPVPSAGLPAHSWPDSDAWDLKIGELNGKQMVPNSQFSGRFQSLFSSRYANSAFPGSPHPPQPHRPLWGGTQPSGNITVTWRHSQGTGAQFTELWQALRSPPCTGQGRVQLEDK